MGHDLPMITTAVDWRHGANMATATAPIGTLLVVGGVISTTALWVGSLLQSWVAPRGIRKIVSERLPGMLLVVPAAPFTNRYAFLFVRILFFPPWRRDPADAAIQQAQGWVWINIGASAGVGTALAAATLWTPWIWVVPLATLPLVLWMCGSYLFDDGQELRDFFTD